MDMLKNNCYRYKKELKYIFNSKNLNQGFNNMNGNALSWEELEDLAPVENDPVEGPTNSQSTLRLFGRPEDLVRITLYRDHHAWCPYCQKVWLWLEFKQIPYKVKKVTMRCYGQKEDWYLQKVPSGMLPALEINGKILTESDNILYHLEKEFGALGTPIEDQRALQFRKLERKLFNAWCIWLCRPKLNKWFENKDKEYFREIAKEMEFELSLNDGPWLDQTLNQEGNPIPGTSDLVFVPYVERMNASLAYYKGLNIREDHPYIDKWLSALEELEIYRGTQGDFHTHAHDLPPQMGGCWPDQNPNQKIFSDAIDSGEGLGLAEIKSFAIENSKELLPEVVALKRVLKHKNTLKLVNPMKDEDFDQPLRAALSNLISNKKYKPNKGSAFGLRYLRDRISVPRDMQVLPARKLRKALELTAQEDSAENGPPIPIQNRLDQNPKPFIKEQKS